MWYLDNMYNVYNVYNVYSTYKIYKMYLNLEVPSWYTPQAVIRSPGLSGNKSYVPPDCAAKRPEI